MWALLPPFGRGIEGLCFDRGTRRCGGSEVSVSPVTCDLWTLSGASVGVAWGRGEAVAVNEAEHTTGIVWKVGKATKVWGGCDCSWVVLPHPHRKWGELLCGQSGGKAAKSLCVFWPCGCSVVLVGLFVGFRWTSGGQSTLGWEWVSLRHRMVVLWVWHGPFLPA